MLSLALCIGALVVITITHWVYRWSNPKCNGQLPPGSMGWPLLGETFQLFKPNSTSDIHSFVKDRMERYGPIFRTSVLGRPFIVSTDSELNYFILQQEGQLFQSWFPNTFKEIFGQEITSIHGFLHKYLRNMVLNLFGPESVKKMLPEVEQVVRRHLKRWSNQGSVELRNEIADMIFDFTGKKLISYDLDKSSENLRSHYDAFLKGLATLPLNVPGTTFHKCLQGRKKAMKVLKNMLQERQSRARKQQTDFFDYVIEELEKENTMITEEIALELMFVVLFASFETTSLILTLAMKFLAEYPSVLKALKEEHEDVLRKRENLDSRLTWGEYKSMTFTFQFINETLRLANMLPGLYRKALQDFEFKGYTIPAGWSILVSTAVHLNSTKYKDPLDFNPWRWDGMELKGASKNFMAFGGGMRFCIGADFAKVQIAVFLHYLVTEYKFHVVKGGDIVRNPGLQFPNGFHVRVSEKDK